MFRKFFLLVTALTLSSTPSVPETLSQKLEAAFSAGALSDLHSAYVEFGGETLGEVYFAGEDESWGKPLGVRDHGPETLHDLRSVTKSVVGLLYGIALGDGIVPPPEAPLYVQFPDYAHLRDPARDEITLAHVLSMQMGLEWNEDLPYSDPRNSEIAMELAPDRYAYILSRPIAQAPGTGWGYNGGATAILGKLISEGSGMALDAFARNRLFGPLGITEFEWHSGKDGVPSAASGLRLTLRDLSKIGRLVVQDGVFEGKQIVPGDWIARSFEPQTTLNDFVRYGYHWYLSGPPGTVVAFAAGNGGQRLTVQPDKDLVVASFSGAYNKPNSWDVPLKVVTDYAVPAAKDVLAQD